MGVIIVSLGGRQRQDGAPCHWNTCPYSQMHTHGDQWWSVWLEVSMSRVKTIEIGGGMMLQSSLHHWEVDNGHAGKRCQWGEGSFVKDPWCDVACRMAVNVWWSEWQWTVCECNSPEGGHSWKFLAWHEWVLWVDRNWWEHRKTACP